MAAGTGPGAGPGTGPFIAVGSALAEKSHTREPSVNRGLRLIRTLPKVLPEILPKLALDSQNHGSRPLTAVLPKLGLLLWSGSNGKVTHSGAPSVNCSLRRRLIHIKLHPTPVPSQRSSEASSQDCEPVGPVVSPSHQVRSWLVLDCPAGVSCRYKKSSWIPFHFIPVASHAGPLSGGWTGGRGAADLFWRWKT